MAHKSRKGPFENEFAGCIAQGAGKNSQACLIAVPDGYPDTR
jgi:hypothetical protein